MPSKDRNASNHRLLKKQSSRRLRASPANIRELIAGPSMGLLGDNEDEADMQSTVSPICAASCDHSVSLGDSKGFFGRIVLHRSPLQAGIASRM